MRTNLNSGAIVGRDLVETRKTVGDLAEYFEDQLAARQEASEVLYETQTWLTKPDGTEGAVLWGNTTLYPGTVGSEYFMTRGHWHTKRTHCELVVTVSGKGLLVLMDDDRSQWEEELTPGSTHHIDGTLAHRTVNTGEEPLVFLCAWPADCGHEYDKVRDEGFAHRYFARRD